MARPSATDRMARILSMVPWIASQDRPRISDVCARFDITPAELVEDLQVVLFVGLYPYQPDTLMEVDIDEEHVSIAYTNWFERPLRLSKDEALAILAAGVASAAQPGHDPTGPLARGLTKVSAALNVDLGDDLRVVLDEETAAVHQLLDRAVRERRVVHLAYFSHARNEHTERDVEPLRLFDTEGVWYVDAHCRETDEHRVFRLDRISDASVLDSTFERDEVRSSSSAFDPTPDLPRISLEIDASDSWVVDQHPCEDVVVGDDGRIRLRLAISARPWLERLLLRLGPSATVLDAPDDLAGAGPAAAGRLLARYRG